VHDIEQRLRRDLTEFTERLSAESIRPLREPVASRRRRAVRWLVPAAAAASVIGVIAAVGLIAGGAATGRPGTTGPAPTASEPSGPAPTVPAGLMPHYYVTAYQTFAGSGGSVVTFAAVHDSATGATLATVRVPTLTSQGGTGGLSITAAGDGRTFVITEAPGSRVVGFYLLHVAAGGRSATLRSLPVSLPGQLSLTDLALSPDGRRLAMDVQDCGARTCRYTGIRVVTLASGAVSSWTTPANGFPLNVSWVGNDRLAFEWQSGVRTPPAGQHTGYRLLSLGGAGRELLAARPIGSPGAEPTYYVPRALVTANGAVVITSTVRNLPDASGSDTVVAEVVELSARTGQLLRVLHTATVHGVTGGLNGDLGQLDQDCNVLSLAPAGVHVLVACFAFGRVDGSRFTPLPGFPSASSSGISGQQAAAW